MKLSLSTHWNASEHAEGEAMVDAIVRLGFQELELGYDLRAPLVAGVRRRVESGAVRIRSVHNFCPVPVGAFEGHPELYLLASPDRRERNAAVLQTAHTIQFASEIGAKIVVAHAGRIRMRPSTRQIIELADAGKQYTPRYERLRTKLIVRREKKVQAHLEALTQSLEDLQPSLEKADVTLALENLPSWETVPNEQELASLLERFPAPWLAAWHDVGHGQIRQNLGFTAPRTWLKRYGNRLAGMHVHDVGGIATDHLMPPHGTVDFPAFKPFLRSDMVLVLEPTPGTPAAHIEQARKELEAAWESDI